MKNFFNVHTFKLNTIYLYIFIISITILHAFTKFLFIGQESLYTDEPYSIFYAQQSLKAIYNQCLQDSNPPLYLFILHFWIKLFGISSVAAKSLSVVANIGTALLIIAFAKKYLNTTSLIIASIIFLFSNIQFYYSHEIRTYALLGFFIVASFYTYLHVLTKPTQWSLLLLGFINVAILFLHYTAIYMHIAQGISALFYFNSHRKGFWFYVYSQILSIVLFLPWIHVVFANTPTGKGWLKSPNIVELKYVLYTLANNKLNFYVITIVFIIFILILLFQRKYISQQFNYKIFILLTLWFIIPIFGNFFVSQYFPSFIIRTVLYSSIGLFLLIGYMISSIHYNIYIKYTIILFILFICIKQFNIKQHGPENWNKMIPKIKEIKNDNTIIIVSPWWNFKVFSYYYNRSIFEDFTNTLQLLSNENIHFVNDSTNIKNIDIINYDTIILLKCRPPVDNIDAYIESKGLVKNQSAGYMDLQMNMYIKP
jgi:uncharacterized membrane protein